MSRRAMRRRRIVRSKWSEAMSTTGLCAWALCFYVVYLIRCGLGTETGQRLLDAFIERIRGPKRED